MNFHQIIKINLDYFLNSLKFTLEHHYLKIFTPEIFILRLIFLIRFMKFYFPFFNLWQFLHVIVKFYWTIILDDPLLNFIFKQYWKYLLHFTVLSITYSPSYCLIIISNFSLCHIYSLSFCYYYYFLFLIRLLFWCSTS